MVHSCGMVKEKKWVYAPDFSGKKLNKFFPPGDQRRRKVGIRENSVTSPPFPSSVAARMKLLFRRTQTVIYLHYEYSEVQ